jgi:hypothetical protein
LFGRRLLPINVKNSTRDTLFLAFPINTNSTSSQSVSQSDWNENWLSNGVGVVHGIRLYAKAEKTFGKERFRNVVGSLKSGGASLHAAIVSRGTRAAASSNV